MPGVRLAVGSVDFDPLGFDGFLGVLRRCEIESVELYPRSVAGPDGGRAAEMLAAAGVGVCCVNVTPAFALGRHGEAAACREETIRCIRWAAELRAPYVNTYIGAYAGLDAWTAARQYRNEVQPVLEAAAAAGVGVLVENLADPRGEDPRGLGLARRPEPLAALAELIGPAPWGLTYDAANFHQAGVEPFPFAYRLLRPHIRHVHARDSTRHLEVLDGEPGGRRVLRDSRQGEFLGVPVGAGAANYDGILAALAADGYRGHIVLEPHMGLAEAEAAVRAGRKYILRRFA